MTKDMLKNLDIVSPNFGTDVDMWYEYLNSVVGIRNLFIYTLPDQLDTQDYSEATMFYFEPTGNIRGSLMEQTLTVFTRANKKPIALETQNHILNELNLKINGKIMGQQRVILCRAIDPVPFFAGTDSKGRGLFRVSFQLLLDKI